VLLLAPAGQGVHNAVIMHACVFNLDYLLITMSTLLRLHLQAKAYTTRVGAGPYPTEIHGDLGEKVRRGFVV
jgi:adenylosuccinate synthase